MEAKQDTRSHATQDGRLARSAGDDGVACRMRG
jgi:hypothetical protein